MLKILELFKIRLSAKDVNNLHFKMLLMPKLDWFFGGGGDVPLALIPDVQTKSTHGQS